MQMNAANTSEPIFHARLTAHRSLGPKGFRNLMTAIVGLWGAAGLYFLSLGAWPVFGFFGLDIALVWWAFRWNYRSARAHEEVKLSPEHLSISKVAPSGTKSEHAFHPLLVKFNVLRHEFIGVTGMNVEGDGRKVSLGSFLNPDDRDSFSKAFSLALAEAKRG
jgi:uncharacterized membrane protein